MNDDNPYRSPRTNDQVESESLPQASFLVWLFFSFRGRIARRHYWGGMIAVSCLLFGGIPVTIGIGDLLFPQPYSDLTDLAVFAFVVPLFWSDFALHTKRLHDRNRSAWWMLFAFVPVIGPIWLIIQTGILPGMPGPNQFGETRA